MTDKRRISAIIAACVLLAPAGATAQAAWKYQLIDYPGTPQTQVFGVNDRGLAVGNGVDDSGNSYPFLYDIKKGQFTDVANVAGYDSTAFLGISDSGRLVGSVLLDDMTIGLSRDVQGADTVFSHPDAFGFTQARGVNNKGLISGYRDSADGLQVGFLYDPKAGTFIDIAPSLVTIAHGMNSQGDVVGSAFFLSGPEDPCPDLPGDFFGIRRYGWLRTAGGALTYFTVNENLTGARGINDKRQIAGYVNDFSGIGAIQKGFVIDGKKLAGASCVDTAVAAGDLLEVPGSLQTVPEGISNAGNVVGVVFEEVDAETGEIRIRGFVAIPR